MSWITDLLDSLTTCRDKIWTRQSYKLPESPTGMAQRPHAATEVLYAIYLGTGTQHPLKWLNSSFTSKCQYISPDSTCGTAPPV